MNFSHFSFNDISAYISYLKYLCKVITILENQFQLIFQCLALGLNGDEDGIMVTIVWAVKV